jgi:hypothetical protein
MAIGSARGTTLTILIIAAVTAIGCANSSRWADRLAMEPAGPGIVFDSVDAAAVDGLAYAYLTARQTGKSHLAHGGTILRVDGGFIYAPLNVANERSPVTLRQTLKPNAVAHFRTYPRSWETRQNRLNEKISHSDRRNVDSEDPLHRPFFVLTPRLIVKAYHGESEPTMEVARLGRMRRHDAPSRTLLAGTSELYF